MIDEATRTAFALHDPWRRNQPDNVGGFFVSYVRQYFTRIAAREANQ